MNSFKGVKTMSAETNRAFTMKSTIANRITLIRDSRKLKRSS